MAFVTLDKNRQGGWERRIGRVTAQRVGKSKQLAFVISPDIAEMVGLKVGTFIDLRIGTESDTGFLCAQPTTNIAARKIQANGGGKSSPRFTITCHLIRAAIPEKSIDLEWRIEDGALLIDIRPLVPA